MGSDKDVKSQGETKTDKPDGETQSEQTVDGRDGSPEFEVADGRPHIRYKTAKKFRPGDSVYVRVPGSTAQDGPYLIASASKTGGYTLCLASGTTAVDGREISEDQLVAA